MTSIALHLATTAIVFASVILAASTTSIEADYATALSPESHDIYEYHGSNEQGLLPAILLALPDGSAKESTLLAWSIWADDVVSSHRTPPAVWIICTDTAEAARVVETPHVMPFVVSDEATWADVTKNFLARKPTILGVGLLGEGALPHPDLRGSVESTKLALFEAAPPTAILTRSRASGGLSGDGTWLSANFVSQLWCNRAAMELVAVAEGGKLESLVVRDVSLLQVLPLFLRDAVDKGLVLVDGTHVIGSIFDVPAPSPGAAPASGSQHYSGITPPRFQEETHLEVVEEAESEFYIGSLGLALVYNKDFARDGNHRGNFQENEGEAATDRTAAAEVTTASIAKAPWPPEYVLETVAMNTTSAASKGLVLMSNVNCGYLDMATNFWLSVRHNSNAKVSGPFPKSTTNIFVKSL